jgi:hypothetical protein
VSQDAQLDPETVNDEQSFLAFVTALAADRRRAAGLTSGPYGGETGWESDTIEDFLEAALNWAEDSSFGRTQGVGASASVWRRVANFLYCGKIYE